MQVCRFTGRDEVFIDRKTATRSLELAFKDVPHKLTSCINAENVGDRELYIVETETMRAEYTLVFTTLQSRPLALTNP